MPSFLPDLVSREEGVFPGQSDLPDLVFDGVCVQFQTAVFKEPRQAGPARQGVADVLGQL